MNDDEYRATCFLATQIDWNNLMLETRVNGEVRQRQNTSEVIFDIPTLMENCSAGITFVPSQLNIWILGSSYYEG